MSFVPIWHPVTMQDEWLRRMGSRRDEMTSRKKAKRSSINDDSALPAVLESTGEACCVGTGAREKVLNRTKECG